MKYLGQYELVKRLGVGGMAEVFLARARRQGGFSQDCVVKVLHAQLAEDQAFTRHLMEEARLIARLRHANIASLLDVGREGETVFLVMEYIDGRDLHAILATSVRREYNLPIPFALHVATNLCRGLHYAHTRQGKNGAPLYLVHRDISPQNVLVSVLGEIKLIDFGVAKFNSNHREKTRAGVIKGKFGYMSPEQAYDEPLDARSDLFSVGICLYEMLTGRSLYGQNDDPLVMLKRAREAAAEPIQKFRPDISPALARLVHKALSRKREDRFQTAHELEQALARQLALLAPGYTNLDAGQVVRDLFDTYDPALDDRHFEEEMSPIHDVLSESAEMGESTDPMHEIPADLRHSGSFKWQNRIEIDPEEPTRALTVKDDQFSQTDFADEKTELFRDERFSGRFPTISPDDGKSPKRPQKSRGRDPAYSTQRIHDKEVALASQKNEALRGAPAMDRPRRDLLPQKSALEPLPRDSGSDTPRRQRNDAKQEKAQNEEEVQPSRRASRRDKIRDSMSDGYSHEEFVAAHALEPRKPIAKTKKNQTISVEPSYSPRSKSSPAMQRTNDTGLAHLLENKKVQVLMAAGFVILALLIVLVRLF